MVRRGCLFIVLALALSRPAVAGTDQWVTIASDHFTVVTDAGDKEGRHILDQFERMRWVFQKLFPRLNVDPPIPITVMVVRNSKGFEALLPPDRVGKGQLALSGMFMRSADKNVILLRLDTNDEHPYASVYHEYTHLQFASAHQWLPIWLNEGMAEFMQNTEFGDKNVVLGEPSRDNILYMRQNRLIPLAVLFKVDANSPYYHEEQKGSVFYAESWALTHFLMMKDHQTHVSSLDVYGRLVGSGEDPVIAAEKAFGDLKQLETALEAYIDHGEYKALELSSAAAPIDEAAFKVRTLSPAEADAARADVMASDGRVDDARALIDAVLKQDPNNIQARETLGFLALRDHNIADARKWYTEAIKSGSQNFLVYYYNASFSIGIDNEEAESDLRSAIHLNPKYAPAYDRLATVLAIRRDHLDDAHQLNVQAIELEPDNIPYRINAAHVLEMMNRYGDAVNALKAAAQVAHDQRDATMIQQTMAQLQQNQQNRAEVFAVQQEAEQAQQGSASQGVVDIKPKFATLSSEGPRLKVGGVIADLNCSYPSEIEFSIESPGGKRVSLYNNDYTKIDLTAAANLKVPSTVNPCSDFKGRTVRVEYIKSQTADVDGQVMAVELLK